MEKPKNQLWVIAHDDFTKFESQISLEPIYGPTSWAEDVIVVGYEGEEQEMDDLFVKLKTEPFKNQIYKITDEVSVIWDATNQDSTEITPIYQVKKQYLRIFREQSKINPAAERVEEVYLWASKLTAESRYTDYEKDYDDYYLTENGKRLLFKLKHISPGEIIGLVGLQGTGKTSMLKKMAHDLNSEETPVFFIHWTPDWFEKLKQTPEMQQAYRNVIRELMIAKAESYGHNFRRMAALGNRIPNLVDIGRLERGEETLEAMETGLTKSECRKAMEEAMNGTLPWWRYLFIDLPDYDRRAMSARNEDLQSIEAIWKRAINTAGWEIKTVFILGIQKETFGGHFFYGKMHIVELEPMKKQEMIEAYKHKWKTTEPFTEEALGLIAEMSRGIFRRFLKYIAMSVETAGSKKEFPITSDTINASITLQTLNEDMSQEMAKIFKNNEEQKMLVVKLLTLLREKPGLNQKDIAEALDISEDVAAVILKKLHLYRYIKREHGERKEWKWYLA